MKCHLSKHKISDFDSRLITPEAKIATAVMRAKREAEVEAQVLEEAAAMLDRAGQAAQGNQNDH